MILGIEIALTIMGLYMLFTGKAMQKEPVRDWRFRLVGGFCLLFWPVVILIGVGMGVYWAITHPDISADQIQSDLKWAGIGVEAGVVLVWALIGHLWHASILKKAAAKTE